MILKLNVVLLRGQPSQQPPLPKPKVKHCLRQSNSDLSNACRSVFEQGTGPVVGRIKRL